MRFVALATDYDGTIARHGVVRGETLDALKRAADSGRRLILVTGRRLDDLLETFPEAHVFDRIVAENGGLLYRSETREQHLLTRPADARLVEALRERRVEPLSVGKAVIATWEPHQQEALEAIKDLGLELQVTFNKGAVMVLPSGVNKASGLEAALADLGLSRHNVAGIGDAENDHAFLSICELGAAVANALAPLKDTSDHVTRGEDGEGVREFIGELLGDDLARISEAAQGHPLVLHALAPEDSFYFRGPDERLNLRAQNLFLFLQIAEGVDDDTWLHHLRRHDYSAWMREKVGDDELADLVAAVEDEEGPDGADTRERVRRAVEDRYTAPA